MEPEYVKIPVTPEERKLLDKEAKDRHMSRAKYLRAIIFDSRGGDGSLWRDIMRRMPDYYNHVNEIKETELKKWFFDWGGNLCLFIK